VTRNRPEETKYADFICTRVVETNSTTPTGREEKGFQHKGDLSKMEELQGGGASRRFEESRTGKKRGRSSFWARETERKTLNTEARFQHQRKNHRREIYEGS